MAKLEQLNRVRFADFETRELTTEEREKLPIEVVQQGDEYNKLYDSIMVELEDEDVAEEPVQEASMDKTLLLLGSRRLIRQAEMLVR